MPIYDQSYRRYEARASLKSIRYWPITREALRLILAKKAFLALLMAAWVPFLGHIGWVYVVTRFPDVGRALPVDSRLFAQLFKFQRPFVILLTIFGGAGLIANDLRTGAILVYLSRPLTRRDYILGKLGVLTLLNLSITLAPGLLFYGVSVGLAPDTMLTAELAWTAPAIVAVSLLITGTYSLVGLAISALSRSARIAGIAFFGVISGLELTRVILDVAFDAPWARLLSLQSDLQAISLTVFGLATERDLHWAAAAAVLALTWSACVVAIRGRVRAVEVVG